MRAKDGFRNNEPDGIPMYFDEVTSTNEGWGVCTLAGKKQVGRSQFVQCDFDLPQGDNFLDLGLGQQVTLCCLDENDDVAKDNYYVYSPRKTLGSFSILVPSKGRFDRESYPNFADVLKRELEVGDEIALKPGPDTLQYRGQYVPVTDMVYFASGEGIVPVLDQVKSVLPTGASSVKVVSVIWTNQSEKNFDVAMDELEEEYYKYSTKLAVSCIVDSEKNGLEENVEIDAAVPTFNPGTMAVVAGPPSFTTKANSYLVEKGYPEDCICVLPSS